LPHRRCVRIDQRRIRHGHGLVRFDLSNRAIDGRKRCTARRMRQATGRHVGLNTSDDRRTLQRIGARNGLELHGCSFDSQFAAREPCKNLIEG
jgi:hypothetical protein